MKPIKKLLRNSMQLIDTHCHIHFADYELNPEDVIKDAHSAGVTDMICVGCTIQDSKLGIEFAKRHDHIWAAVGLHPHEADSYVDNEKALQELRDYAKKPKVIAIGEIGLDYYYEHSSKESQKELLRFQLSLAQEHALPVIFHVRDAFDDFWPIYDEFKVPGVIHSFSAGKKEVQSIIERGLYVGLNGIMTFTKNQEQLDAVRDIPLANIVVETDAPYLTPTPYRGTICQPKHVVTTAEFLSSLRQESLEDFARATTQNAQALFNLS
jgi:TatD DNase family protein